MHFPKSFLMALMAFGLATSASAEPVKPISQLPSATVPLCDELVPLVQMGVTKRAPACAFGIPIAGGVAPTPVARYQLWWNTSVTPSVLQQYDGTSWVRVGTLDPVAHVWRGIDAVTGRFQIESAGSTLILSNADCGSYIIIGGAGPSYITTPTNPLPGCSFTFDVEVNGGWIDFNTHVANIPGWAAADISILPVSYTTEQGYLTLVYNTSKWVSADWSGMMRETVAPADNPRPSNGQVLLSHTGGHFQLLRKNGPGGILINDKLHQIADAGLYLVDAATINSTTNNIYVQRDPSVAVTGTSNHGGLIQLAIANNANAGDQVTLDCHSIGGTYEANGVLLAGTVIDGGHIDIIGSTYTHPYGSGGRCRIVYLSASTSGHTQVNGVEVNTLSNAKSLVGVAAVGAAHVVISTSSWYNGFYGITGAIKHDGAGLTVQAACADLSDGAIACVRGPATLAGLGTCNAGAKGAHGWVTDANAAVAFNAAVTGGGANEGPVSCSGSAWVGG